MEGVGAVLCLKFAKTLHELEDRLGITGEVGRDGVAAWALRAGDHCDSRLELEDLCLPQLALPAAVGAAYEAWKPDVCRFHLVFFLGSK